MRRALLLLVLALAGCGPAEREKLGPEWFPLRYVQQDVTVAQGECSTYRSTMRVRSLRWWRRAYPAGSVQRKAILFHELRHALRSYQVPGWLERYQSDKAFRLQEEKDAYQVQFEILMDGGVQVDEVSFAYMLSGPLYGYMTDFASAVSWANDTCLRLAAVH